MTAAAAAAETSSASCLTLSESADVVSSPATVHAAVTVLLYYIKNIDVII